MEDNAEDLTTAYMLGVHDGRKAAQAAKLNHQTNDNMNNELLTKTQREAWNSSHEISELKKENEELKKDKERLDFLVDKASISMLRKDEDGEEWWVELAYSEARKDIDEYMNQSPSIFDDLSDSQRQQICREHGQPTQ